MWSPEADKKIKRNPIKKNKNNYTFELYILPLCRAGPAGPIFTLFGMSCQIADKSPVSNMKSIGPAG